MTTETKPAAPAPAPAHEPDAADRIFSVADAPDRRALEPKDFAATVRAVRCVERIMGDGVKRPALSEDVTDRRAA